VADSRHLARLVEDSERLAQQVLDGRGLRRSQSTALGCVSRVSLAKAETAESLESLRVHRHGVCIDGGASAVRAAIGVAKDEPRRHATCDDELAAMHCTMVSTAKDHEVVGVVESSFGAKVDMVNVDESGVSATGNEALPAVTTHHPAPYRGRYVLVGSRNWRWLVAVRIFRLTHVGGIRPVYAII